MKLFRRYVRRPVRNLIASHPTIYIPIRKYLKPNGSTLGAETELVIEGFPRSGNSFAEAAFRTAQKRPRALAHHSHASAQVLAAAREGTPCLVLFREPFEAARSLWMHHPGEFGPKSILKEWLSFYSSVAKISDRVVYADFVSVTSDFGRVIDAVNHYFGTAFDRFEHSAENELRAFELVDTLSQSRGTIKNNHEPYSPNASIHEKAERAIKKSEADEVFNRLRSSGIGLRCIREYERLLSFEARRLKHIEE